MVMAQTASAQSTQTCLAGFGFNIQGTVVTFFDSSFDSIGTVTSWQWSFGDGTGSTQQNPVHTFNAMGTYTVCLTISTSSGCMDSTCHVVTIGAGCPLTAGIVPDTLNNVLHAVANQGTPPYTYSWSLNGNTIAGANGQTYTPTTPGQYCVTITDANNCTASACYNFQPSSGCSVNAAFQTGGGGVVHFFGMVAGNYSYYTWTFGDGDTSSVLNPVHTYANPGTYIACLTAYDSTGNVCNSYCVTININAVPNDSICGKLFWDTNGNGIMDPGEAGIPGGVVTISGNGVFITAQSDSNGCYVAPVMPGTYTIVYCTSPGNVFTIPLNVDSGGCAYYHQVVVSMGSNGCGYNFGIQNTAVTIEGMLFIDANNNGTLDAGESGIPYQGVSVGGYTAYSNPAGIYSVNVPAGTYTVSYTPTGLYAPYSLSTPGSITVNATTVGNTYGGNHFGLYIPPGTVNLSVNLSAGTTITPGFPAWYYIQVCNIGITPTAATLTMNYDAGLSLDYANPTQASNNTTNNILTWNLPVIAPGGCVNVFVDFDASTSYQVGASVVQMVNVSPVSGNDVDLTNNVDTVHQIVTSSWDPNNKLSVKTNTNNPNEQVISSINSNQTIEYTVNFQNTGSAPAVNVVVLDDLSPDLDASTFQLLGTSHNCNVTQNGSDLQFVFSNIMLPDSTTNEPASHGHINFRVDAVNALPAGTVISDQAAIYFDFNAPVLTNFANVLLVNPLGINESGNDFLGLTAWPNPTAGTTQIQYELTKSAEVTAVLHDASGRRVATLEDRQQGPGIHTIAWDASSVGTGIYLLELRANGHRALYKLSVF